MSMTFQTNAVPLAHLAKGQTAVIEEVQGKAEELNRLHSMGFCAGTLVRMLCPGRCCAVQVGDCRVVLRGKELSNILVSALF